MVLEWCGFSCLDCFLVSMDWEDLFPDMVQRRMARPFSDHFPICLESLNLDRGKVPFRFENMWLEFEGVSDLIREWWGRLRYQGLPAFVVASKLKYLKAKLKVWDRETFGDIRVKKHKLLKLIKSLDLKKESFWSLSRD